MERKFTAKVQGNEFVITESVDGYYTRQGAWDKARSQTNPVVFVDADGTRRELGDCFDASTWERSMYTGHVSYELSMTDGHYAPEDFETWIAEFRQFPRTTYNDATPETLAAFSRYTEMVA